MITRNNIAPFRRSENGLIPLQPIETNPGQFTPANKPRPSQSVNSLVKGRRWSALKDHHIQIQAYQSRKRFNIVFSFRSI